MIRSVFAQEALTLTISPPTTVYKLNPGETKQGVIKLINNTSYAISFKAGSNDFIVEDSRGTPVIIPPNTFSNRFSASSWINIESPSFVALPNEPYELSYSIAVPYYARPGGHYASILFNPKEESSSGENMAKVETQVGSLVSILVNGPISEHSQITRFIANTFQEYGPIKLFAQIKNFGDVHIKPVGTVAISDLFGRSVKIIKLEEANIFPEAVRDYETAVGDRIMIGRFKAKLSATYGLSNNLPLEASLYFWVFPWKIGIVVVLAVIVIILTIIYLRRSYSLKFKIKS